MPTNITIKNTNQRNHLKLTIETSEIDPKTKKISWKPGADKFLKPGETEDIWVAETRRVITQEMPT